MENIYRKEKEIDLKIVSSVFEPNDEAKTGDILFKIGRGNKTLYKVLIYINGIDLAMIKSVRYYLHPTFKKNVITSNRDMSNLHCSISIWAWGLFEVKAKVLLTDGRIIELTHNLDYDQELRQHKNQLVEVK